MVLRYHAYSDQRTDKLEAGALHAEEFSPHETYASALYESVDARSEESHGYEETLYLGVLYLKPTRDQQRRGYYAYEDCEQVLNSREKRCCRRRTVFDSIHQAVSPGKNLSDKFEQLVGLVQRYTSIGDDIVDQTLQHGAFFARRRQRRHNRAYLRRLDKIDPAIIANEFFKPQHQLRVLLVLLIGHNTPPYALFYNNVFTFTFP